MGTLSGRDREQQLRVCVPPAVPSVGVSCTDSSSPRSEGMT